MTHTVRGHPRRPTGLAIEPVEAFEQGTCRAMLSLTGTTSARAFLIRKTGPGRRSAEEVIVFDSTGSAVQDVAVAGAIYERAREKGLDMKAALA